MIPTIPLSFNAISINRRDGSCTAHYYNQVDFVKLEHATSKPKLMPEVNRNIDENMMSMGPSSSSAINEQISRSMHDARNQLFDLQDNHLHNNVQSVQRKERGREHSKASVSSVAMVNSPVIVEKIHSKLAFAMDPWYNVLWVYDSNNRKILCYNVLASEIPLVAQVKHFTI